MNSKKSFMTEINNTSNKIQIDLANHESIVEHRIKNRHLLKKDL